MYVARMTLSPLYERAQRIQSQEIDGLLEVSTKALGSSDFGADFERMSGELYSIESPPSALLQHLDRKAGDLATYYFAAFSETRDVRVALAIYRAVRSLIRYILMMDRYFEVGNKKFAMLAKSFLASAKQLSGTHLNCTMETSILRVWPYWRYERQLKKRLIHDEVFQSKEIRYYNRLKSADAGILYSSVLDASLPSFDETVSIVLHYNQGLQDLRDDFDDIDEDLAEKMPNAFLLAATEQFTISQLTNMPKAQAAEHVRKSGSVEVIMSIAEDYMRCINRVELPRPYWFLKTLSHGYFSSLERAISPYRR
jgi:hypothetical protein